MTNQIINKMADVVVQMTREEKVTFIVEHHLTPATNRKWFLIEPWMNRQILRWAGDALKSHSGEISGNRPGVGPNFVPADLEEDKGSNL